MQQNRLVCLSIVFIANLCMFIYVFIDQVYCLFFIAQRISIDLLSTHIRIEQSDLLAIYFSFTVANTYRCIGCKCFLYRFQIEKINE